VSWDQRFSDPIVVQGREAADRAPRRRNLHHEAAEGPQHEAPEWQAAMQALILVATSGGPTMLARIGMMRALSRHQQQRTKPAAEGDQKV
jgi:hypothetical protein